MVDRNHTDTLPELPVIDGVEFRHVPNFPGYCAGDDGSVWSCRKSGYGFGRFKSWQQLKTCRNTTGRLAVTLAKDRKTHTMPVHYIILLAFNGLCPIGLIRCHEDGNHLNNRANNLRYDTRKSNESDKERHGRKLLGDRHPVAKLNEQKVLEILSLLAEDNRSLSEIARKFEVNIAIIARIRDGEAWKWVKEKRNQSEKHLTRD